MKGMEPMKTNTQKVNPITKSDATEIANSLTSLPLFENVDRDALNSLLIDLLREDMDLPIEIEPEACQLIDELRNQIESIRHTFVKLANIHFNNLENENSIPIEQGMAFEKALNELDDAHFLIFENAMFNNPENSYLKARARKSPHGIVLVVLKIIAQKNNPEMPERKISNVLMNKVRELSKPFPGPFMEMKNLSVEMKKAFKFDKTNTPSIRIAGALLICYDALKDFPELQSLFDDIKLNMYKPRSSIVKMNNRAMHKAGIVEIEEKHRTDEFGNLR